MSIPSKPNFLFIGDSITRGGLGVNFVPLIVRHFGASKVVNLGKDGESLNLISQRLMRHLQKKNDYDYIICAGGLGDVGLSVFLERGPMFRFAHWVQRLKGIQPLEKVEAFEQFYDRSIKEAQALSKARFVMVTLNCLNEKRDYRYNHKRAAYNQAIKRVAAANGCLLADAAELVDQFLVDKPQRDYHINNFWAVTYSDPIITLTDSGADWLSKIRKLHLTIDGVHLNSKGAGIFAEAIIKAIEDHTNAAVSRPSSTG